ncbi:MAG TPA: hypothetical protein VFV99_02555 [Kofleriaceae bacterium]|nr:hypothetical protein [Kofleriaceae bacterium]
MTQQHSIVFVACLGLVSAACSDNDTNLDTNDEDPEGGGTIELDLGGGTDSFWADTDGVDPEVAGCHIEFTDDTCSTFAVPGRNFGEFCQNDGTLIESNPGKNVCHTHEHDIGHPYVVDCYEWCTNMLVLPDGLRRGIPADDGECVVVHGLPCDGGIVESAKCVCH